jgi:DNA-binding response OmpR family regulator
MPLTQILLIEDDPAIRLGVGDALEMAGYCVTGVESGEAGLKYVQSLAFDLILLDLVLPGQDGMLVMRSIREIHPSQAVIMLTARGDVQDRIRGLGLGADDYVVKPFNVGELLARVEAVLRRVASTVGGSLECTLPSGTRVDFHARSLQLPDGRTIQLSERENDLLRYLFTRRGQIISRDELIERVWGINPRGLHTRTVDMHIARLREKIGDTRDGEQWIVTVRGRGYRFNRELTK